MILLSGILAALSVLVGIRLSDAPVSTSALLMWTSLIWAAIYNGLLWSGCCTSISSSVKVMTLVVFRKAWLAWASATRQCVPKLVMMDTRALVVVLLNSFLSPQLIEQSSEGRASLKSRDSCWGHTCTAGLFIPISPTMKEYSYCGFPSVMLRQWVLLDLLLTSEVQNVIWNFLMKCSSDCSTISSSMTHILMIPTIKGLSHIFRGRLSARLKGSKHSISHPFVDDRIHFFIGGWNGRILFLFFPFSLLPNY